MKNSILPSKPNWRDFALEGKLAFLQRLREIETDRPPPGEPEFRGAALELRRSTAHEVMIAGPAETGKTFAALVKLDRLLLANPGAQAVLVRKVRDTIFSTVLETFQKKVLYDGHPAQVFGGKRPQWYDYPGGGRLWLAGMDDPGKALSSERDVVYVNQAEELTLDDWQTLCTRATGRAGNVPHPQVFGDCNPGPPHHWIKNRPSLKVLESRHEDNPVLFQNGQWTEQGKRTLAILDSLTGVRLQRLRYGRWVSAEGTVYAFDPAVHVIDASQVPKLTTRIRSLDFGYTNPFVCGWLGLDHDGRLYLYREIYMSQRTVKVHAEQIKEIEQWYGADENGKRINNRLRERIDATVADHDAGDCATLRENGIFPVNAEKDITRGIQAVEDRLKVQPDGKPRLYIVKGCLVERDERLFEARHPVNTEQEFDTYAWPKGSDGKPVKEKPLDVFNHGMDMIRYGVMWADRWLRGGPESIVVDPRTILDQIPRGVA